MQSSSFHFFPPFFWLLVLVLAVVFVLLQIKLVGYAYEKMGISRRMAYLILFLSLAGSWINIPVAELPPGQAVRQETRHDAWGTPFHVRYLDEWPETSIALNVGGAIIPTALSIYLMVKHRIYGQAALGVFVVSAVVYRLAEPVQGMGISVPIFLPPIVSALVAMLLSRQYAPPLAYISGCMGTLVGADLLNIGLLGRLGASIASIGGAGTFDGVFLTGVLAVLLAVTPRTTVTTLPAPPAPPRDPVGQFRDWPESG